MTLYLDETCILPFVCFPHHFFNFYSSLSYQFYNGWPFFPMGQVPTFHLLYILLSMGLFPTCELLCRLEDCSISILSHALRLLFSLSLSTITQGHRSAVGPPSFVVTRLSR